MKDFHHFHKRIAGPRELLMRLGLAAIHAPFLLRGLVTPQISPILREKIMLSVTAVNDCRYCAWAHTRLALRQGMSCDEIQQLLQNDRSLQRASAAEATAILFAQHFADTQGHIDPEAMASLQQHFSASQRREILASIHAIYLGNLIGNTFEYGLDLLRHACRSGRSSGHDQPQ